MNQHPNIKLKLPHSSRHYEVDLSQDGLAILRHKQTGRAVMIIPRARYDEILAEKRMRQMGKSCVSSDK